jgi:hypothetical protein
VVRSAEPVDTSRLTPVVGQMLRDLVDTFNVFIVGDPKGRELDQIRLGPRERAAATTIIDAALPIVDAIRESQGVVTAAAFEALAEQLEVARNVASGIDGDQAIELSRRTTTNFTAELLRAAYARVRAEPELLGRSTARGFIAVLAR